MATEKLNISGWDSGWPTGFVSNVDEAVSVADGSVVSTNIDSDTVIFDLTNSALTNSDTITGVDITLRASSDTSGGGLASLNVSLLVGGVSQGTAPVFLNAAFTNHSLSDAGWDSDWTEGQLDGMQVRVVSAEGLPNVLSYNIDCLDVIITYTASTPFEPPAETLFLTGKIPT